MCGIIGFIDKKNSLSKPEKEKIATAMLQEIEYRGRDSFGVSIDGLVTIGHRRLAIIDISKKANQPFSNTSRTLIVSYNGEIFNHLELRRLIDKQVYQTTSDTETFLCLYEKLRDQSFGLIRGMFAVSFFDKIKKEIVVAVDRFGIKPLYYINTPDWFAWSSESKTFNFLPGVSFSLNENRLFEYGVFRTISGSGTLLNGVSRLKPGELIRYDIKNKSISTSSYSYAEVRHDTVENLLKSSVSEHILSDVPIGFQLSGGVDSGLISALATKYLKQKEVHSFSIGLADQKWNEFDYSRLVAKQIKTEHHEIKFSQQEFCELLPTSTYHLDEPISYPNTVPMMILAREARKYVKVLLSGEGADEIFGGYLRYNKLIREKLSPDALTFSNSFCSPEEISEAFILNGNQDIFERDALIESIKECTSAYKLCLYDLKTFLPSLLLRQDKMGMASNLENRFPFLDPRLVTVALELPDKQKFTVTETKIGLKKIARKYLLENIVNRKKIGFGLPIANWLKDTSGLGKYLNLFKEPTIERRYLNYNLISERIHEHVSGKKDNSELLWILITLEVWARIFIDGVKPNEIWDSL